MSWPSDWWIGLYLFLFAFGLIFTIASLFLNVGDDLPDLDLGGDAAGGDHASGPSPLCLSTVMIFLTWFGAAGDIARAWGGVIAPLALILAAAIGFVGATLVYLFLARIMWRGQTALDPRAYELQGTIARVSSSIREGGTGEIVYSIDGKQRVDGARSLEGQALPVGAEVTIVRYEGGLAYVAPLDWAANEGAFLGNPIEELAMPPPGKRR
jgi:membrane protein implicated in regulation of membrane protease activity